MWILHYTGPLKESLPSYGLRSTFKKVSNYSKASTSVIDNNDIKKSRVGVGSFPYTIKEPTDSISANPAFTVSTAVSKLFLIGQSQGGGRGVR